MADKMGAEKCKKRVFLGGYSAKYGSKNGTFWSEKPGKRPYFCVLAGKSTGAEGIFG
jgi:hypothetical protein